jgi:S-adenosylmethionine:tRNA ribosyltransferase-isomerase
VRLKDLDFDFPEELIAQRPMEPRDSCRLMHLGADGSLSHRRFTDFPDLLQAGDSLVFNDTRVLPAHGRQS